MHMFWNPEGSLLFEAAVEAGGGGGDPITAAITSSIADAEGGDDSGSGGETLEPTADDKAAADEEAEIGKLVDAIKTANPQMKPGTMDLHRHQAVLTRARNLHKAEMDKIAEERKAEQERIKNLEAYEDPEIQAALSAMMLAGSDHEKFIEMLLSNETYGKLLKRAEAEEKVAEALGVRPEPNATSPDGKLKYYDNDGLTALLDWHGKSVMSQAEKKLMAQVEKQYGPLVKEYQARNAWNQSLDTQRKILDGARAKWKGFKEHEEAIKTLMTAKGNEAMSLDEAYREVVIPKFEEATRVNREKLRKELLEEIDKKGKAVSENPRVTADRKAADDGEVDLADIIRASLPKDR